MANTTRRRAGLRRSATLLAAAGVLAIAALGAAGAANAAADPDGKDGTGGFGLTVTVPEPATGTPPPQTAPPSSSPTPPPASKPPASTTPPKTPPAGSGAGSGGGKGSDNTVVTGPASNTPPSTPGPGEFDLGGIVYVSGLNSEYLPSINPFDGDLVVHFTARNVSSATITSSARFWVSGPFGNTLGEVDPVSIPELKPDEIRLVSATIHGMGQWTFVNAHATFTPPANVQGTQLTAVTRDGFVFFPPWLLIVFGVAGTAGFAVARILREIAPSEAGLVGEPA